MGLGQTSSRVRHVPWASLVCVWTSKKAGKIPLRIRGGTSGEQAQRTGTSGLVDACPSVGRRTFIAPQTATMRAGGKANRRASITPACGVELDWNVPYTNCVS